MRLAAKRDANEAQIVADLRALGFSVEQLSGKDIPDLLIGFQGRNWLVEVKRPGVKKKLRPGQSEWHQTWRGDVIVAETTDEILKHTGVTR